VKPLESTDQGGRVLVAWVACPGKCGRTVSLTDGVLGVHLVKRENRRFPKMQEECPMSGRVVDQAEEGLLVSRTDRQV
jgi:hypothetical protein